MKESFKKPKGLGGGLVFVQIFLWFISIILLYSLFLFFFDKSNSTEDIWILILGYFLLAFNLFLTFLFYKRKKIFVKLMLSILYLLFVSSILSTLFFILEIKTIPIVSYIDVFILSLGIYYFKKSERVKNTFVN